MTYGKEKMKRGKIPELYQGKRNVWKIPQHGGEKRKEERTYMYIVCVIYVRYSRGEERRKEISNISKAHYNTSPVR